MIKIEYTTHSPASTTTTYMHMDRSQQEQLLKDLETGLLELLERSTYDDDVLAAIYTRDSSLNRHNAGSNNLGRHVNNNLVSFLSGLLRQHRKSPTNNISLKMLKGIKTAIALLQHFGVKISTRDFVKVASPGVNAAKTRVAKGTAALSTYNQLFAEG